MRTERHLRYAEFVIWVVVVAAVVVGVAGSLGYVLGGDLVAAKRALFAVGVLMFGVGTFQLQPVPAYREKKVVSIESEEENALEERIQQVPPLKDEFLPYHQRVGRGPKVFVASLLVLAVSLFMEVGFGVAVG